MNRRQKSSKTGFKRDALLLALVGIILYVSTLAPTVLWIDDAWLQMNAALGILQGSAGSHPLWVWVSHQFTKIPVGDIAGRVNLVSAIFGALTLGLLHMILREIGVERGPSVLATLAFMVSHTFWSYSVRAEVYTLTMTLMTLLAWASLRWYNTGRQAYLVGAGFVFGLGLTAHLIVVLYVPALLWLVWQRRNQLSTLGGLYSSIAVVVGTAPLVYLLVQDAMTMELNAQELIRWAVFSFEGYDFSGAFFDFSLHLFPSDLLNWLAFLGIQFVGLAGICGIIGGIKVWRIAGRDLALYLLLLYLGVMLFAFAYRVGERYAFYLPSYLPFAIWIGFGLQWTRDWLSRLGVRFGKQHWFLAAVAVLIVSVPVVSYRISPELVARGITFRDSRHVPGPKGKYFFLWPPKAGYDDPRVYAEKTLDILPLNAVLLTDPILANTLLFLQKVEGVRTDVTVRYCCWDIETVLEEAGERPLALADAAPEIYPIEQLSEEYEIKPLGSVYLLIRKHP
jgi:hypothetical protein